MVQTLQNYIHERSCTPYLRFGTFERQEPHYSYPGRWPIYEQTVATQQHPYAGWQTRAGLKRQDAATFHVIASKRNIVCTLARFALTSPTGDASCCRSVQDTVAPTWPCPYMRAYIKALKNSTTFLRCSMACRLGSTVPPQTMAHRRGVRRILLQ